MGAKIANESDKKLGGTFDSYKSRREKEERL